VVRDQHPVMSLAMMLHTLLEAVLCPDASRPIIVFMCMATKG